MNKRRYTLRARAEKQEETKAKIVEATIALHEELGPARTSVSAIAERAGVQRLTVYRYFPDDSLLHACSMLQAERHPLPDPADWAAIADPERRLRRALRTLYRYYRDTADYLAAVGRTGTDTAVTDNYLENVMATLVAGWKPRGKRAALLDATLEHVLRFETWRSLTAGSALDDKAAARLATRWVRATARKTG